MNMNGEHQEQNVINQRREALIEDLIGMISGRQVGDVKNILRGIHEQEGLSLILDFRLLYGICLAYVNVRHEADDHIGIHDSLREECYDLISFACNLFEKSEHPITMVRYEDEDGRRYSLLDVAILTRNHHLIRELFRRADDGTYYSNTDEDEIPLSNYVQECIQNYVFSNKEDRTLMREEKVYMEKVYSLTITQQEIEDPITNGSNRTISFICRVLRSKVLHQKMREVAVIEDNSTKEVLNARISMIISSLHTTFGVHPSHILDSDNNSFLHLSIAYENVAATRALLEAKVSVDRDNSQRNTPLDNAVAVGNQEIFEMLCHRGADIVWVENPTTRELVPKDMVLHDRPDLVEIARRTCQAQSVLLFSKIREYESSIEGLLHSTEFATFSASRRRNTEKRFALNLSPAQVTDPVNSFGLAFFPMKWDAVNQFTILDVTIAFKKAPADRQERRVLQDLEEFFEVPKGIFFKFNSKLENNFWFQIADSQPAFDFVAVTWIQFSSIRKGVNGKCSKRSENGQMPSTSNGVF